MIVENMSDNKQIVLIAILIPIWFLYVGVIFCLSFKLCGYILN